MPGWRTTSVHWAKKLLEEIREAAGRWAWKKKKDDPQIYLVPGIPEANTDEERVEAASIFRDWVQLRCIASCEPDADISDQKAEIMERIDSWVQVNMGGQEAVT